MIRVRLSAILGSRRIKMAEVARATGVSTTTVFNLYHEKVSAVSFDVLGKLCEFLQCQPGDILEWEPDRE
ncbi:MAG: helix-turn-helix transcriptional regulator [Candidatus Desulforudis sp.]|nr:helix-turn-helix transcriptional regulator [Desulforudis sp.]